MARGRKAKKKSTNRKTTKTKRKPSPNIVAEVHARINGKPAVIRVYRKNWKYKDNFVATVRVGRKEMGFKAPRGGKGGKKKKKR